jgi:hypothetical protein
MNKNATLKPPLCKDPTTIPTRVGMVLLFVYWVAMGAMVVAHGVTAGKGLAEPTSIVTAL